MRYLILILLLSGCNDYQEVHKDVYEYCSMGHGFCCQRIEVTANKDGHDCVDINGNKYETIWNTTNIFKRKKK